MGGSRGGGGAVGGGGDFPLASVGSRGGGDNRKRARSAQRRVGPKDRLTAMPLRPGRL
jgi:hypothetical protein